MSGQVKRLWVLLIVLVLGFSSIWMLPKQQEMVPSRLMQDLPDKIGGWESQKRDVSEAELKILAADTEFARRFYYEPGDKGFPGVEVSVVFSGKDINNSLHRPEVCLRAQGWNFVRERTILVPSALAGGDAISVREIVCVRPRIKQGDYNPPLNNKGEPLYDKRIQYYTFFGAEKVVSGHYERTFEDIKGRLFGGFDQQWAYATFSVAVTSVYRDQGFDIPDDQYFDEEQSVAKMEDLMRELLPEVVRSVE